MVQKLRNKAPYPVVVNLVNSSGGADSIQIPPHGNEILGADLRVAGQVPTSIVVTEDTPVEVKPLSVTLITEPEVPKVEEVRQASSEYTGSTKERKNNR